MLRVALFEYGNIGLPASEGYIRQVVPLTDDLDNLSESLFGLTTNGGDEYCGQVIDRAVKSLDWSKATRTATRRSSSPATSRSRRGQSTIARRAQGAGAERNCQHRPLRAAP